MLVDRPGVGRSHREAPEIDGVVFVDAAIARRDVRRPSRSSTPLGCDLVAAGADPAVAALDDV